MATTLHWSLCDWGHWDGPQNPHCHILGFYKDLASAGSITLPLPQLRIPNCSREGGESEGEENQDTTPRGSRED